MQGHPEFSAKVLELGYKAKEEQLPAEDILTGERTMFDPTDSQWFAAQIVTFLQRK